MRLLKSVYRSIENLLLLEREYDPEFNILGFGIGKRIRNNSVTAEDALRVYVDSKIPINRFPRVGRARPFNLVIPIDRPLNAEQMFDVGFSHQDDRSPGSNELRIDVVECRSRVLLQSHAQRGQMPRVLGGASIGLKNETEGTAGTIVRNNPKSTNCHGLNRDYFLLTAGHVLNNHGAATTIDLCHPGPSDLKARGLNANSCVFATKLDTTPPLTFSAALPFPKFTVDAGVAGFTGSMVIDQFEERILYCGGIRDDGNAKEGTIVRKVGRTTGLTLGQVISERGSFTIFENSTSSKRAILSEQILTTAMSREGDSGAVLLDEDNRILGLLCAGGEDLSVFTPIEVVLDELGVELF